MNCRETRKWLSPYLDSELEQTKTFEVSEHLRHCRDCAQRFEREREAERLMKERINREQMPGELWQRLAQDVSTPDWIKSLTRRRILSAAAIIAVVLVMWRVMPDNRAAASTHWLVQRFESEVSTDLFAESADDPSGVLTTLRNALRLELQPEALAGLPMGHKDLQIVSAHKRTDPTGRIYYEVRLNCCGYPTLMALVPNEANGAVDNYGDAAQLAGIEKTRAGVHLGVRAIGSVTAVALSRHHVDGLLDMLTPMDG